jgi:outer membrane protein W
MNYMHSSAGPDPGKRISRGGIHMRKYMIALLAVAALSGAASAGSLSFGLKGGLDMFNITSVPEDWDAEKSFRYAAAGGIFMNYAFSPALSLQPELLLVMKGANGSAGEYDIAAKYNYVEMPVLLKYAFRTGEKIRPSVFAGPAASFNVTSDFEIKASGNSVTADFSDASNKFDFGLVAGTGLDFDLKQGTLSLDLRYQMGLVKLIKGGTVSVMGIDQEIAEEDARTYGIVMMLGYSF